jgi:hypothetical protein
LELYTNYKNTNVQQTLKQMQACPNFFGTGCVR